MYVFREEPLANAMRAVDISSTDHACESGCVGIYVGVGGTVILAGHKGDATVTHLNAANGQFLRGQFKTVVRTSTTATDMVEYYFDRNP